MRHWFENLHCLQLVVKRYPTLGSLWNPQCQGNSKRLWMNSTVSARMLDWISNETQRSRLAKVSDLIWVKPRAYWTWIPIKDHFIHRRPTPDTEYSLSKRSICRCGFIVTGHRMNLDAANHLTSHFGIREPSFSFHGYAFACCQFRVHLIRLMSFWSTPQWFLSVLLHGQPQWRVVTPDLRRLILRFQSGIWCTLMSGRLLMCFQ